MAIFSVRSLWRARTRGGGGGGGGGGDFPVQSSTWQWRSRPGQPAQAARPNIRVYGACAVCRCVLVRIYGGVFMRDSGRSLQVVHYVQSPN